MNTVNFWCLKGMSKYRLTLKYWEGFTTDISTRLDHKFQQAKWDTCRIDSSDVNTPKQLERHRHHCQNLKSCKTDLSFISNVQNIIIMVTDILEPCAK
jgi:hypothetical protein